METEQLVETVLMKKSKKKYKDKKVREEDAWENLCQILSDLFCQFCKIFKNIFFTEHLRWLLLPTLKAVDSQRQWCKWISELLTIISSS